MDSLQAKVTSKGQVTLPKQLRESLSIRAGDRLEFSLEASNKISVRKKKAPGASAGCGRRFLQPNQKPVSVEEMDEGIRKSIAQEYAALRSDS